MLQRAFFYFLCTVSGCDGGNRTRNIAVYTWRFSPLSYDRHPTELRPSPYTLPLHNGTLQNGKFKNDTALQNGTALRNSTVTKLYIIIKRYMLQNGTLQNITLTKRYSTKRYIDIMVGYICIVHYSHNQQGFTNPRIG